MHAMPAGGMGRGGSIDGGCGGDVVVVLNQGMTTTGGNRQGWPGRHISGWFASLMAGAVFVEYVFDWKGIGVVIVSALETYDFPVVMGAVLLISVMLVLVNITVDILYGMLDPRVRMQ